LRREAGRFHEDLAPLGLRPLPYILHMNQTVANTRNGYKNMSNPSKAVNLKDRFAARRNHNAPADAAVERVPPAGAATTNTAAGPCLAHVGRSGPNLEPGTMRVYVTNGPRNGLNIGKKIGPCSGSRRRGCWVLFMPFIKPLMPQTHTIPGCT